MGGKAHPGWFMENILTEIERKVMDFLLRGDDPVLEILRKQLRVSKVSMREFTGVGFFTHFKIPENTKRIERNKSFKFGDVEASIEGLKHGAGFLLHVEKGALDVLEGYSYDETWPSDIRDFKVSYIHGHERDISSLRKKWSDK